MLTFSTSQLFYFLLNPFLSVIYFSACSFLFNNSLSLSSILFFPFDFVSFKKNSKLFLQTFPQVVEFSQIFSQVVENVVNASYWLKNHQTWGFPPKMKLNLILTCDNRFHCLKTSLFQMQIDERTC